MEQILQELPKSPLIAFTILLLVILVVPPIFERLRLPGLVGLLAAGVVLGPDGLGILNAETETMKLLSDIGKIYLMFVAGLEIDLEDFRKNKDRSLGFGIATFLIPLIFGAMVGRFFGFGWNASILIGSLARFSYSLRFSYCYPFGSYQQSSRYRKYRGNNFYRYCCIIGVGGLCFN